MLPGSFFSDTLAKLSQFCQECYQILFSDTLPEFHLKSCRLLQVDVEGLHDRRVQVVGVVGQQVRVRVLASIS
jgi:hypothetical protein